VSLAYMAHAWLRLADMTAPKEARPVPQQQQQIQPKADDKELRTPCGSSAEQSRRFRVVAAATGRPGHSRSPKARTAPLVAGEEAALPPPAAGCMRPGAFLHPGPLMVVRSPVALEPQAAG